MLMNAELFFFFINQTRNIIIMLALILCSKQDVPILKSHVSDCMINGIKGSFSVK
jgi:hypothetical protein